MIKATFLIAVNCLFILASYAQSFDSANSKLIWNLVSDEQRLSFKAVSTGEIAMAGEEAITIMTTNRSQHTLFYSVTLTITSFSGDTKTMIRKRTIEPGRTIDNNPFNDGEQYAFSGEKKNYGTNSRGAVFKSFIQNVSFEVNEIKDITQENNDKQQALKQKQDEAAQERQRLADENKAKQLQQSRQNAPAITANTQPSSYYSNTQRSNNTTSTTTQRQPTWQETNARIQAENQQRYQQQQQLIAQQQENNRKSSEEFVNNVTEMVGLIGNFINQNREEKEKKEQKRLQREQEEADERRRQQEERNEIARRKALRLELRNSFVNEFPEGGVPLSSQRLGVRVLYYFTYMFDKNTIADESPYIYLSNIFPIAQYGDGTWPFKTNIIADLKKLNTVGTITLVGYFTTMDLANQMRGSFIELANKSDFLIKDVVYKGKPATGAPVDDVWGDGKTPVNNNTIADDDIWSNDKKPAGNAAGKAKLVIQEGEIVKKQAANDDDIWSTEKKPAGNADGKAKLIIQKGEVVKKPVANDDDIWSVAKPEPVAPPKKVVPKKPVVKKKQ